MRRRSLFLALALALVVGGFGALDARASSALLSDLIAQWYADPARQRPPGRVFQLLSDNIECPAGIVRHHHMGTR